MSDPTKLEHARAMKRMGVALNTPVEERQFAVESSRRYCGLWDDLTAFCHAMFAYNKAATRRKYETWKKAHRKIYRDARALIAYAGKLEDQIEAGCLRAFVDARVKPFYEGWLEVFEALEGGEQITIAPVDKWEWNPLEAGQ